jgi:hypothetical protein
MVDLFIFVSEWQKNRFLLKYEIDESKTIIMRNGIGKPFEKYLDMNCEKINNTSTYCSIPWRGLDLLREIFPIIKNEYNNYTLNIYSGLNIYQQTDTDEYKNYLLAYINENHLVHGLPEPGEVYQTSKMHLTNQMKSIVINTSMYDIYNQNENAALAKDIYKRRLELKTLLFETE